MIKAVLLDLDGTLLDTIGDIAATHNTMLKTFGFPARETAEFNTFIGGGIMETIQKAAPPGTPAETLDELNRRYQAHYPEHCTELTRPYDGMVETLQTLARSGKTLAVFTNKTEHTAQRMVAHFFRDINFQFVWGNDGVRPLKPAPDAGIAACAVLGLAPNEIAYVGDSDVDILFALAAGFLPIGACWGYRGAAELQNAGATLLAERPSDLLNWL